MELLDTHQHLFYRSAASYSWTDGLPELRERDFTLEDFRAATGEAMSGETIFMEGGSDDASYQDEARHIVGLVGKNRLVGVIASCRPETDAGFDAWLEEAHSLGVKGFRRILHVVPDDVSQSEPFRRNLRKIGKAGLPFDICMFARQHGITLELLRACPDQPFVLDHCGNPDVAAGGFKGWAATMKQLAAYPNLSVKMSGIAVNCAPGTATLATIRPYVDYMIDMFGPSRIVWGSDWPVVNLACGLREWITMTKAMLADLSPSERAAISAGNARRIYSIEAATQPSF